MAKKGNVWLSYFTKGEWALWMASAGMILISFFLFDRENPLTLIASLIGVTSLIFNAKGHPFGQLLMVAFSILYGVVSFTFSYYGEMMTYLGMTCLLYTSLSKRTFVDRKFLTASTSSRRFGCSRLRSLPGRPA